jgi:transcriptional regulator with XRE-family HTH domain
MPINPEFGTVLREAVGRMKAREICEKSGISQPYVSQMFHGQVPSWEILVKLVAGIPVAGWHRAKLFALAGYMDPRSAIPLELPPVVAEVARELVPLSPRQLEIVRRLVEQPHRLEAVGSLLDPSVMSALAAAVGPGVVRA